MTFNDKVDKFMDDNGIKTLKRLAILSSIPYTTLKDLYDKKSAENSRLCTIRRLAQFMNCSIDYLAYEKVEPKTSIVIPRSKSSILEDKIKGLSKEQQKMVLNVVDVIVSELSQEK